MSETSKTETDELDEAQPDPGATEITVYIFQLKDERWLATMVRGDLIRHAVGRDEAELRRFMTSALIGEYRLTQEQVDKIEVDLVRLEAPKPPPKPRAEEPKAEAHPAHPAPPRQQQAQTQHGTRPGMRA